MRSIRRVRRPLVALVALLVALAIGYAVRTLGTTRTAARTRRRRDSAPHGGAVALSALPPQAARDGRADRARRPVPVPAQRRRGVPQQRAPAASRSRTATTTSTPSRRRDRTIAARGGSSPAATAQLLVHRRPLRDLRAGGRRPMTSATTGRDPRPSTRQVLRRTGPRRTSTRWPTCCATCLAAARAGRARSARTELTARRRPAPVPACWPRRWPSTAERAAAGARARQSGEASRRRS